MLFHILILILFPIVIPIYLIIFATFSLYILPSLLTGNRLQIIILSLTPIPLRGQLHIYIYIYTERERDPLWSPVNSIEPCGLALGAAQAEMMQMDKVSSSSPSTNLATVNRAATALIDTTHIVYNDERRQSVL